MAESRSGQSRNSRMRFSKRLFDLVVAGVLLVLASPLFVFVTLLIRFKLGSPVLFTQIRPGLHGQPFRMVKYRTMTNQRDSGGDLLPDSVRLTSFGKFLRATSLDELPELWNVFVGHMSLVGPRPLLMEYLPLYTLEQMRRHDAKPGITGWAQVNGRNAITWERKFELDVWYVNHQSFWLDIKILLMTAVRIFKAEGITQENHATAEPFRGKQ